VLSKDDQALATSRLIAGGQERLGWDGNTAEIAELGDVVVDMSDVKATDSTNHGKFAQLAEIAPRSKMCSRMGSKNLLPPPAAHPMMP
jgi:esterase/lipase superfamily enzyme